MTERRATKESSTTEERAAQEKANARTREGQATERKERGRPRHTSFFLTLLNFLVLQLFSIRLLPLAFRNSSKTANLLKWRIWEIISLSFARNLENWNFEILETRNMQKIENRQSTFLNWENINMRTDTSKSCSSEKLKIRKERKFDTWTTNENTSVEI